MISFIISLSYVNVYGSIKTSISHRWNRHHCAAGKLSAPDSARLRLFSKCFTIFTPLLPPHWASFGVRRVRLSSMNKSHSFTTTWTFQVLFCHYMSLLVKHSLSLSPQGFFWLRACQQQQSPNYHTFPQDVRSGGGGRAFSDPFNKFLLASLQILELKTWTTGSLSRQTRTEKIKFLLILIY